MQQDYVIGGIEPLKEEERESVEKEGLLEKPDPGGQTTEIVEHKSFWKQKLWVILLFTAYFLIAIPVTIIAPIIIFGFELLGLLSLEIICAVFFRTAVIATLMVVTLAKIEKQRQWFVAIFHFSIISLAFMAMMMYMDAKTLALDSHQVFIDIGYILTYVRLNTTADIVTYGSGMHLVNIIFAFIMIPLIIFDIVMIYVVNRWMGFKYEPVIELSDAEKEKMREKMMKKKERVYPKGKDVLEQQQLESQTQSNLMNYVTDVKPIQQSPVPQTQFSGNPKSYGVPSLPPNLGDFRDDISVVSREDEEPEEEPKEVVTAKPKCKRNVNA